MTANAEPAPVVATTDSVAVRLDRGHPRPWNAKWDEIARWHEALDKAYTDPRIYGGDNVAVEAIATLFFTDCPATRKQRLNDKWAKSNPLAVASAVANTHTHHTIKRKPKPGMSKYDAATAFLSTTLTGGGRGAELTVEVRPADGSPPVHFDCLRLGDDCMAELTALLELVSLTTSGQPPDSAT